MEHPENLNLVNKVSFFNKENSPVTHCKWELHEGEHSKSVGPLLWPTNNKSGKLKPAFREDSSCLIGEKLLFIIKSPVRDIPFVATVKNHFGTMLDLQHANGYMEKIDLKNPSFDDSIMIRRLTYTSLN